MTKIFQLLNSLNDGGVSSLVRNYSLMLKQDGFDVYVIVIYPNKKSSVHKALEKNGIKIISLYPERNLIFRLINRLCGRFILKKKLKRLIDIHNPSVIHVHSSLLGLVCKIKDSLNNTKLFYTCHSIPERYFAGDRKKEYYAAKELIRDNDMTMIGLHQEMVHELNGMFGIDTARLIYNGVNPKLYYKSYDKRCSLRAALGIPKNAFVIGHVGRFEDVKNHKYLVSIYSSLRLIREESFLVLVGDGSLQGEIEDSLNNIKADYRILSHRTDIPDLLNIMDVFVFPSKYEGMPLALIEAQYAGRPCVVSKNINKECVFSTNTHVMDINLNPEEWAKCIASIENRPETVSCDKFDLNMIIKKLEKLYME